MNDNSIIPTLTREQKDCVRLVLETEAPHMVLPRLALAPPAGIGVRMSRATLYRLKKEKELQLEEDLSDREGIRAKASAVANEEQDPNLKTASLILLREKAFRLTASESPADLRTACAILRQIETVPRENGTKAIGQFESSEQFRLEVARLALLRFGEIGSIRGNQSLSEERKQRMIAERLFPPAQPN
jgi:hypothetical protein